MGVRGTLISSTGNRHAVNIILNGEPYELDQPLTVDELLARLDIDSRRVAIEYNLSRSEEHTSELQSH